MIPILLFNSVLLLSCVYLLLARKSSTSQSRAINSFRSVYVDTSGLVDGRLEVLAYSGFLPYNIVVPSFVVEEMQGLADSSNADTRSRGRAGLDLLAKMQTDGLLRLQDFSKDNSLPVEVDMKLVAICKSAKSLLYTTDFNLQKVAGLHDVRVLNVNGLTKALKQQYANGDVVQIVIKQKGNSKDQGVGYMSDGTMVVVTAAARHIGESLEVRIVKSLQTEAGRMYFAEQVNQAKHAPVQQSKKR
jgi:uncharacterized protein YacL